MTNYSHYSRSCNTWEFGQSKLSISILACSGNCICFKHFLGSENCDEEEARAVNTKQMCSDECLGPDERNMYLMMSNFLSCPQSDDNVGGMEWSKWALNRTLTEEAYNSSVCMSEHLIDKKLWSEKSAAGRVGTGMGIGVRIVVILLWLLMCISISSGGVAADEGANANANANANAKEEWMDKLKAKMKHAVVDIKFDEATITRSTASSSSASSKYADKAELDKVLRKFKKNKDL